MCVAAVTKQTTDQTQDGLSVHSFRSLLADLATLARNIPSQRRAIFRIIIAWLSQITPTAACACAAACGYLSCNALVKFVTCDSFTLRAARSSLMR